MMDRVKGCWNGHRIGSWSIENRLYGAMHAMNGSGRGIRFDARYGRGERVMIRMHAMHGWGLTVGMGIIWKRVENLDRGFQSWVGWDGWD